MCWHEYLVSSLCFNPLFIRGQVGLMVATFTRVRLSKENFVVMNVLVSTKEIRHIGVGMNACHITRMVCHNFLAMDLVSI